MFISKKIFSVMLAFSFLGSFLYPMQGKKNLGNKKENAKAEVAKEISIQLSGLVCMRLLPSKNINKAQLAELIKSRVLHHLAVYSVKSIKDKTLEDFAKNLVNEFLDETQVSLEVVPQDLYMQEQLLKVTKINENDKGALVLAVKNVFNDANKPSKAYMKVKRVGNVVLAAVGFAFYWVVFSFIYQGLGSFDSLPKFTRVLFSCVIPLIAIYLTSKIYQVMPDCIKPSKNISKAWNGEEEKDKK